MAFVFVHHEAGCTEMGENSVAATAYATLSLAALWLAAAFATLDSVHDPLAR